MFKNSCRGSRTHPTQTRLDHFQICKSYSWKCFSLTDNEQLLSIRLLNNHRHCSSGGYFQIRINAPGWNRTTVKCFGDLFLTARRMQIRQDALLQRFSKHAWKFEVSYRNRFRCTSYSRSCCCVFLFILLDLFKAEIQTNFFQRKFETTQLSHRPPFEI